MPGIRLWGQDPSTCGRITTNCLPCKDVEKLAKDASNDAKEANKNAHEALKEAEAASNTAGEANDTASNAINKANKAIITAGEAKDTAGEAKDKADYALKTAGEAKETANGASQDASDALVVAHKNTDNIEKFTGEVLWKLLPKFIPSFNYKIQWSTAEHVFNAIHQLTPDYIHSDAESSYKTLVEHMCDLEDVSGNTYKNMFTDIMEILAAFQELHTAYDTIFNANIWEAGDEAEAVSKFCEWINQVQNTQKQLDTSLSKLGTYTSTFKSICHLSEAWAETLGKKNNNLYAGENGYFAQAQHDVASITPPIDSCIEDLDPFPTLKASYSKSIEVYHNWKKCKDPTYDYLYDPDPRTKYDIKTISQNLKENKYLTVMQEVVEMVEENLVVVPFDRPDNFLKNMSTFATDLPAFMKLTVYNPTLPHPFVSYAKYVSTDFISHNPTHSVSKIMNAFTTKGPLSEPRGIGFEPQNIADVNNKIFENMGLMEDMMNFLELFAILLAVFIVRAPTTVPDFKHLMQELADCAVVSSAE